VSTEIFERAGRLVLKATVSGPLAELTEQPVQEYDLVPVDEDLFVMREETEQTWTPVTFYTLDGGQRYLHYGMRAQPKIS
jgi:hypothetical protein